MKAATCPKCGNRIWVPAYEGDGAPPHTCPKDTFTSTSVKDYIRKEERR